MTGEKREAAPVIVRKYANRRLYDTAASRYVTLDDLCAMVKDGVEFEVRDARTGKDITRSVLTQIIFEQEARGEYLLPVGFLRRLIGCYDDGLRALVPPYLEVAMDSFADNSERMRRNAQGGFGEFSPLHAMRELGEANAAAFRNAMGMFDPFARGDAEGGNGAAPETPGESARAPTRSEVDELRAQLSQMQERLDALSRAREAEAPGGAGDAAPPEPRRP